MSKPGSEPELPQASQLTKKLFYLIQQLLIEKHDVEFEISRRLVDKRRLLIAECKRYSVSKPDEPIEFSIKLPLEDAEIRALIKTYITVFDNIYVEISPTLIEQRAGQVAREIVAAAEREISEVLMRRSYAWREFWRQQ
jgi:hypothetical protein